MSSGRAMAVARGGMRGVSTLGWVSFFSVLCTGCSGVPVLAGIFGGVAVTTRFGVSAGVVTGVWLIVVALRRRRAGHRKACAVQRPRGPQRRLIGARPGAFLTAR
jgi:hypothetical protein